MSSFEKYYDLIILLKFIISWKMFTFMVLLMVLLELFTFSPLYTPFHNLYLLNNDSKYIIYCYVYRS